MRTKWWVTWKQEGYRRWLERRYAPYGLIASPPRGRQHDPERTRAKALAKRSRQSKDRR